MWSSTPSSGGYHLSVPPTTPLKKSHLGQGTWPPWPLVPPAVPCGSPRGLGHVFLAPQRHWGAAGTMCLVLALGQALRCQPGIPKSFKGAQNIPQHTPRALWPCGWDKGTRSLPLCLATCPSLQG